MNETILIICLIAGGALIYVLTSKQKTGKIERAIAYEIAAQAILDNCSGLEMIDRAILIRAHNGGDFTKVYSPKYITVLHEGTSSTATQLKSVFQCYPLDQEYKKIILTLMSDKTILIESAKEESGFLKRRFEMDGINSAYISLIQATANSIYYCSFESKKPINDFLIDPSYSQIEALANKLRLLHRSAKRAGLID